MDRQRFFPTFLVFFRLSLVFKRDKLRGGRNDRSRVERSQIIITRVFILQTTEELARYYIHDGLKILDMSVVSKNQKKGRESARSVAREDRTLTIDVIDADRRGKRLMVVVV